MSTTQIVPHGQDTAIQGELYMSFELGQVVEADGQRWPTRPEPLQRGRRRHGCGARLRAPGQGALPARAASHRVHSCYEAGRDGWWLHRWLSEQGIDNLVVDSASIEVNRPARRTRTARIDSDKRRE